MAEQVRAGGRSALGEPSIAVLTIRLIGRLRAHHVTRLAAYGLSIPEANVLLHLQPGTSMPMTRLAALMGFDKSNLTTVMTKLERQGLVERDPDATDRRVRLMRLTGRGAETRRSLEDDLSRDSPLTRGLDDDDRRALERILARLAREDGEPGA